MAIMFNYAVKYGGKFYPPNTPIVEAAEAAKSAATAEGKGNAHEKEAPVKKATKSRKKGDA